MDTRPLTDDVIERSLVLPSQIGLIQRSMSVRATDPDELLAENVNLSPSSTKARDDSSRR